MKITETELTDLLKKVYEGMGLAYGDTLDCAHVIAWLAMHGVLSLDELAQRLPNWQLPASQPATILHEDETRALIQSHPSLLYNGLPLELAIHKAQQHGHSSITLKQAQYPFLLIPHLAALPQRGFQSEIAWGDTAVSSHQLSLISEQLSVISPPPSDLTIHITPLPPRPSPLAPPPSPYHHHNQNGLDVSPSVWTHLLTLSKNILVPESEQSRLRGAGEQAG